MEDIKVGDTVRHKTLVHLDGGVAYNVMTVEDDRAHCDFLIRRASTAKNGLIFRTLS